jgi:hypothetical protein
MLLNEIKDTDEVLTGAIRSLNIRALDELFP